MEQFVALTFRFVMYAMFGLAMEATFAAHGIDFALGYRMPRRVPKKYLEGFVSLYMIPLHGFGLLFVFEPGVRYVEHLHVGLRFLIYCVGITAMEAGYGWLCHKVFGFYSWDYYRDSRFRIFREGYTLWTLVPLWGLAGLVIEVYSALLLHLSPHVVGFFMG